MTEPDLRLRAVVPAAPKVVYEALTDPAALRVWLAEHADAALRRYHELPQWRTIWRQIEIAGVPEGMFSIDQ
jgi:uncharacterized protein YndB with AHSA1/START domain